MESNITMYHISTDQIFFFLQFSQAVNEFEDAVRPATDTLKAVGPEGLALGAAALGLAALGAISSKGRSAKVPLENKDRKPRPPKGRGR